MTIRQLFVPTLLAALLAAPLAGCVAEDGSDAMELTGAALQSKTSAGQAVTSAPVTSTTVTIVDVPVSSEDEANEIAQSRGGKFGKCGTCVFVIERIKKGANMLLPSICTDLVGPAPDKLKNPVAQACGGVVEAIKEQYGKGNNLFEGCYKYEAYQSKEWVKPCPSHVMCSVLKDFDGSAFCN